MSQPVRSDIKQVKKQVKRKTKNSTDNRIPPKKNKPVKGAWKKNIKHQEYGTSKLVERFAHNILDKLDVKYIYQYKAESIGRYFDFCIPSANLLLEVDGDFYHSYGLVYEEMSPMQKKNKRVDEQKNHWAYCNGFKLIRIWEHDINDHPEKVLKMLKEELYIGTEEKNKKDNMKKRH